MMRDKLKPLHQLSKLDMHRETKAGVPECVLALGKPSGLTVKLITRMALKKGTGIATKVDSSCARAIKKKTPSGYTFVYSKEGCVAVLRRKNAKYKTPARPVGILTAGSSDIPVAEEARVSAHALGCRVLYDYDVGAAGMHRLIKPLAFMRQEHVCCIVVLAGMDGVLPTLVKSLVDIPVIGVPTSIGYGVGAKGATALNTMLHSCSPGLLVVNIDNGFGAACAAYLIAKQAK